MDGRRDCFPDRTRRKWTVEEKGGVHEPADSGNGVTSVPTPPIWNFVKAEAWHRKSTANVVRLESRRFG
jgi:hypothetical protein